MTRVIVLSIGWLVAALALYVALLILDLYWNLFDWQPKVDPIAVGLIIGVCAVLVAVRFLVRATSHRIGQGLSLVLCVALLGLAFYLFPPEPLTQGLFAREHRALRHVNLQRARHALSSISCHPRRMGGASLVASSCYTCASYRAPCPGMVSIANAKLTK